MISTGKSDWERDIRDDKDSLAAALLEVTTSDPQILPLTSAPPTPASTPRPMTPSKPASASLPPGKGVRPAVTGLFHTSDSKRTSVLNGSHKTLCHEDDHESVLVFPDFQVVTEVRRSVQGAYELWESAVDPEIGCDGSYLEKSILKTWVLPYSCVILLCECVCAMVYDQVNFVRAQARIENGTTGVGLPRPNLNTVRSIIPLLAYTFCSLGSIWSHSVHQIVRIAWLGC